MVLIFVLIVFILWLALRGGSSREDLPSPAHDEDHGHSTGHDPGDGHAHAAAMEAPAAAADAAMAEPQAPVAAEMAAPDDLTKIEGIGPKVQSVLNAGGIHTFSELASAETDTLRRLLDEAEYRYMNPGSWPRQAGLAASGNWEALEKLQDDLKGGV
jgi:predicted flap endonuclease-1-like 5' DNA nuclease